MKNLLIVVLTFVSLQGFSQSLVAARLNSGYDLGMAYRKDQYHPSIAYYQLINIDNRKFFSVGWTMRLGAFYGNNMDYYTAPARLQKTNIDTIRYDHVTMTSLNVGVRAQVKLGRVDIGASADLIGLTLGRSRTVRYQSSNGQFALKSSTGADSLFFPYTGANAAQKASPSLFNLRLLGDNNLGTLATEVYARVWLTQRVGIKFGYQWLITEATVKNRDTVNDNDRFRNRTEMAYVAVSFPIFN